MPDGKNYWWQGWDDEYMPCKATREGWAKWFADEDRVADGEIVAFNVGMVSFHDVPSDAPDVAWGDDLEPFFASLRPPIPADAQIEFCAACDCGANGWDSDGIAESVCDLLEWGDPPARIAIVTGYGEERLRFRADPPALLDLADEEPAA